MASSHLPGGYDVGAGVGVSPPFLPGTGSGLGGFRPCPEWSSQSDPDGEAAQRGGAVLSTSCSSPGSGWCPPPVHACPAPPQPTLSSQGRETPMAPSLAAPELPRFWSRASWWASGGGRVPLRLTLLSLSSFQPVSLDCWAGGPEGPWGL